MSEGGEQGGSVLLSTNTRVFEAGRETSLSNPSACIIRSVIRYYILA